MDIFIKKLILEEKIEFPLLLRVRFFLFEKGCLFYLFNTPEITFAKELVDITNSNISRHQKLWPMR